jgi:hypothetical protein
MSNKLVIEFLWNAGEVLQVVVFLLLLWRGLWRHFPLFSVYIASHLVRGIVLSHAHTYVQYFYRYWAVEAADYALGMMVVYEIYRHVFRRYEALRSFGSLLFRWCFIVLGTVAIWLGSVVHGTQEARVLGAVLALGLGATFISAGLLSLLFVFTSSFGLTWKHYAFGIAIGFGLFLSIDVASFAMRVHAGSAAMSVFSIIRSSAYGFALLTWIGYFATQEAKSARLTPLPSQQLERWNASLAHLLHS